MLQDIPLTANGKLDKRGLPAPEYSGADHYRAPMSMVEQILSGIYAQVEEPVVDTDPLYSQDLGVDAG
ncbi:hypothetical protein MAHJHV55_54270 [Mycobacterium avium subsp. hominissuis]